MDALNFLSILLRPEAYVILEIQAGKNPITIFVIVFIYTAILTFITYYGLNEIAVRFLKVLKRKYLKIKKIKPKKEEDDSVEKFDNCFIKFLKSKGKYLILIPFALPVIPGIDAAAVLAARSLKINISYFLTINAVKFLLLIFFI